MQLILTRDSVAMGDDATAPNERTVDLPDPATLGDLVDWLQGHRAGASVWGGATWALRLSGAVVAVLGQDPDALTATADGGLPLDGTERPHLEYLLHLGVERTLDMVREDPTRTDLRDLGREATRG